MNSEIERNLRPELSSGERLLWSGQPRRGVRLQASDLFLIPFSLLWGGFVLFWEVSAIANGTPLLFRLWGVPFVLMGLYLVFGRFVVDALQRSRTFYGITSERLLIVTTLFQRQLKSMPLRGLPELTLKERSDRSGTITFGSAPGVYGTVAGSSWPSFGSQSPPSFDMVENVRQVYEQIRTAQMSLQAVGA